MSHDENLRPDVSGSKPERIDRLINSIENHEAHAAAIDAEIAALGLDAKRLKAIRTARRTLNALMGIDPATAAQVQS
jgi:hypothetical protein